MVPVVSEVVAVGSSMLGDTVKEKTSKFEPSAVPVIVANGVCQLIEPPSSASPARALNSRKKLSPVGLLTSGLDWLLSIDWLGTPFFGTAIGAKIRFAIVWLGTEAWRS